MSDDNRHPDLARLAAYADRLLTAPDRVDVQRHLADCADCRRVVARTMESLAAAANPTAQPVTSATEPVVLPFRPTRSTRWMSVAAALATAALVVLAIRVARPAWLEFGQPAERPELRELVAALATEPTRPVEGRLAGGFAYGPPPSPTRGAGDRDVSPDVKIAAATIQKRAQQHPDAEHQAALGVAHLTLGNVDDAIALLEQAVASAPRVADYHANLAAAYIERARTLDRRDDWTRAAASAERALALDPQSPAARFNRALALEHLQQRDAAAQLWRACADAEQGGWRDECARHLEDARPR